MSVNLIVANSTNGVIGKDGKMPWDIPEELKRFKKLTLGHVVIMGRKTYESIGRALKGRCNLVLSKKELNLDDAYVFSNAVEALKFASKEAPNKEVFIIGGASIYFTFLSLGLVDRIYQTVVKKEMEGDCFFDFNKNDWEIVKEESVYLKDKEGVDVECDYIEWVKNK